jgi:hypothetical protein
MKETQVPTFARAAAAKAAYLPNDGLGLDTGGDAGDGRVGCRGSGESGRFALPTRQVLASRSAM